MRKLLITLMLVLIATMQLSAISVDSLKVSELQTKNKLLEKEISELKKSNDLKQITVEGLTNSNNYLSVLVTIISIVFGIGLPASIFFLEVKPARKIIEEVKNIDEKVEKKLQEYLKDEEARRMQKAIENIDNPNEQISENAMLTLSLNQAYNFTEQHLAKVYALLCKKEIIFRKKSVLAMILTTKQTSFGDSYFSDILMKEKQGSILLLWCIRYYCFVGIDNYMDKIIEYIFNAEGADKDGDDKNKEQIYHNYTFISGSMIVNYTNSFIKFINNEVLNSQLEPSKRKELYDYLSISIGIDAVRKELKESLLAQ